MMVDSKAYSNGGGGLNIFWIGCSSFFRKYHGSPNTQNLEFCQIAGRYNLDFNSEDKLYFFIKTEYFTYL
jgi:hypothetical protein